MEVLWLGHPDCHDVHRVGAKAANPVAWSPPIASRLGSASRLRSMRRGQRAQAVVLQPWPPRPYPPACTTPSRLPTAASPPGVALPTPVSLCGRLRSMRIKRPAPSLASTRPP
jgi:hypothetical protein